MNTRIFTNKCRKFFIRMNLRIDLKSLFFVLVFILFSTDNVLCQKSVWRYVTTVYGGTKSYLNDEIKTLDNGNKNGWEKMIMPDGSFAIALAEWDCRSKRRVTKQISFYKSDQTIVGTTKKQYEWSEIIPGSTLDLFYQRVCLPPQPVKWARIISLQANLRSFPDTSALVTRIADQGDIFRIVPETGKGGWYNIVDVTTQQDYWLHGNTFEIVELPPVKQSKKKKSSLKNLNQKRKISLTRRQTG